MTIVTNESHHDGGLKGKAKCCACYETLSRYPFLVWHSHVGDDPIILCSDCCVNFKSGLVADLIQITAIRDLQDIGYKDQTLIKERIIHD